MTCLELETRTYREGCIPVLETERLILRAPKLEDAKHVAALANDKRIAENTRRIPHPYSRSDAEDFIAAANTPQGDIAFLITTHAGLPIGACGLAMHDDAAPEIGYWLGVKHWGKGYGTEAVRAVIDFAFTELAHESLCAGARVINPASRRILEKCGFQWTGVGLCRIQALNSSAPIDRFRLDRGLWASLRRWSNVKRVS
ncbi:GNAT family N-acetyltransferase [Pseudorhodoplanes sp.]|jgi:RimJ/RimL family protein N-acetyltransferase|uniref:GNAT family N-acetyltransferase n=1 Tax=Pseudorhodoplanes sp. TaxID=1934341 RepID=UPI002BA1230F|nr:GNAT family N-acetyltransferase [Pseudorhodoplanes sp.]HWV42598.1 GNAT family N-acetyltransferase [Pseudorhodoplanes sp.]